MAKNVAKDPAVAKAVARIKKVTQLLRDVRVQLKEARETLCCGRAGSTAEGS